MASVVRHMGALESCSSGSCMFSCPDSASVNAFMVPLSFLRKELINIPEAGTLQKSLRMKNWPLCVKFVSFKHLPCKYSITSASHSGFLFICSLCLINAFIILKSNLAMFLLPSF